MFMQMFYNSISATFAMSLLSTLNLKLKFKTWYIYMKRSKETFLQFLIYFSVNKYLNKSMENCSVIEKYTQSKKNRSLLMMIHSNFEVIVHSFFLRVIEKTVVYI